MKPSGRLKLGVTRSVGGSVGGVLSAALHVWLFFLSLSLTAGLKYSTTRRKSKHPLKVYVVELEPYVMAVPQYDRHGNVLNTTRPVYQGYMVDLIRELARVAGFKYTLKREPENKYGHRTTTGWDGIIGAVMQKKADIGAAPLFVTEHRQKVVAFTEPFLHVSATLLLRKPPQGQTLHIRSVSDLVRQSEIQFGTLNTGLILYSFRNSNETLYKVMYRKMTRFKPSALTETNEEGINRVRTEKYAFVIPSTIGDYISKQKPCDLMIVDNFLMNRGFALALHKNSPLLKDLNEAMSQLRASGFLDRLYDKWWTQHSECNGIKTSKVFSPNRHGGDCRVCSSVFWLYTLLGLSAYFLFEH